jgi:hypothetical protein
VILIVGFLFGFNVNYGVVSGVEGHDPIIKPHHKNGPPFKMTCVIGLDFVWFTWILSELGSI